MLRQQVLVIIQARPAIFESHKFVREPKQGFEHGLMKNESRIPRGICKFGPWLEFTSPLVGEGGLFVVQNK